MYQSIYGKAVINTSIITPLFVVGLTKNTNVFTGTLFDRFSLDYILLFDVCCRCVFPSETGDS